MPEKETLERARQDAREGKHGARNAKQAIAIGLSKARRAGIDLPPPKKGKASKKTRSQAERDYKKGHSSGTRKKSAARSRATKAALKREGSQSASHSALSRQARSSAKKRGAANRRSAARKAARTRAR